MNTLRRTLTSVFLAGAIPALAFAQAPAAPAAGAGAAPAGRAGGRGAQNWPRTEQLAAFPPALANILTAAQQASLDAISQSIAAQNTAATAARTALTAASLAVPANRADITAKAAALAQAEVALAIARAEKFSALQAGPGKIPTGARTPAIARINSGGGGRGGFVADDFEGFVSIFDGKTLAGWDGDPKFWRAEGGSIVGQSTAENPVTQNTFLIWTGGKVGNFELKTEFRISGTNSGIQYRSQTVPAAGQWVLTGYQADMDFANMYPGQLGEERGRRNIMVTRGQMMRVGPNDSYKLMGMIDDPAEIANSFIPNGWNTYHIIARGEVLIHILNGRVSMIMIDEDPIKRALGGVIGLQMHTGAPFIVEYRNMMYKAL